MVPASPPRQPANQYFRNADLCTLFVKTMSHNPPSLLTFRSITRESWTAVMLEKPGRKALMLSPQPEGFQGYVKDLSYRSIDPSYGIIQYPFILRNRTDEPAWTDLHHSIVQPSLWSNGKCTMWSPIGEQIINLHPALGTSHQRGEIVIWVRSCDYDIFHAPPLFQNMFLTQPPQKVLLVLPDDGEGIRIEAEEGVRLRDLVACLKQRDIDPGKKLIYWRYDGAFSVFNWNVRIAHVNTALQGMGESDLEQYYDWCSFKSWTCGVEGCLGLR